MRQRSWRRIPSKSPTFLSLLLLTNHILSVQRQILDLLESWLRHKSDMVNFEAARAICEFQSKASSPLPALAKAVSVLQLFLSSPKPVQKFAAIRTLSALAAIHPSSVAACNLDMENLITDSNRSIATYAITTLLKVSSLAFCM